MMERGLLEKICQACFGRLPEGIERCTQGIGNYVYKVTCGDQTYSLRCSREPGAYADTVHWLERLGLLDIPVPQVQAKGSLASWEYLVLTWLEGQELGPAYSGLSKTEKETIAREAEAIQRKTAALQVEVPSGWCWRGEVDGLLDRAELRIRQNGYFDPEKVNCLREASKELDSYFSAVPPVAYLDDVTTKNLLIKDGRVSGVIDVDWIGIGDKLTYAALTRMALLDLGCDTDYVTFLLEEMNLTPVQKRAFQFYTLLYCVDFMGERGMYFLDKQVPVSPEIVEKLNRIFDDLWAEWLAN